METLPDELLEMILNELTPKDFSTALAVDKKWNRMIHRKIKRADRISIGSLHFYGVTDKGCIGIRIVKHLEGWSFRSVYEKKAFKIAPIPRNALGGLMERIFKYAPNQLVINVQDEPSKVICLSLPRWWLDGIQQLNITVPGLGARATSLISRMFDMDCYECHYTDKAIYEGLACMQQIQVYRSWCFGGGPVKHPFFDLLAVKSMKSPVGLKDLLLYENNHRETFADLLRFLKRGHFAPECRISIIRLYGCDETFFDWLKQHAQRVEKCKILNTYVYPYQIRIFFSFRGSDFNLEIAQPIALTYWNFAMKRYENHKLVQKYAHYKSRQMWQRSGIRIYEDSRAGRLFIR